MRLLHYIAIFLLAGALMASCRQPLPVEPVDPVINEAWWQDTDTYPYGIAWWWHRQNSAFKGIVENTF